MAGAAGAAERARSPARRYSMSTLASARGDGAAVREREGERDTQPAAFERRHATTAAPLPMRARACCAVARALASERARAYEGGRARSRTLRPCGGAAKCSMGGDAPEAGDVRATHRAPTAANPRADSAPWLVARAGCDPLNLAEDADNLRWYREAELQVRACRGERAACARARACVGRLSSLGEPAPLHAGHAHAPAAAAVA